MDEEELNVKNLNATVANIDTLNVKNINIESQPIKDEDVVKARKSGSFFGDPIFVVK
jgi:hypothetical protein